MRQDSLFDEPSESLTPLYDDMVLRINEAYEHDQGQEIAAASERLRYYARIAQDLEPERKAIEVRIRAERGARRLLKEMAR